MEQHEQESQQKASREHSSSMSRKHPVRGGGETGDDRQHPHSSKGKCPMANSEVEPAQQNSGHGNSTVSKVPLQISVSEKDCSSDNRRTRGDSLVVLIKKFIDLIKQTKDGVLYLEIAQATLEVTMRRMYDITNALQNTDLIETISKGRIRWKGPGRPGFLRSREETSLQKEIETLKIQEGTLEYRIREMKERLRNLREDENNQSRLHVTREDIINLPCFQNEALILVKAPPGTSIQQVTDPREDGDFQERRYKLFLRSNTGAIHLWRISPYEENLKTTNPDGEAQPSIPGTSSANENASVSPLTEEIRERTGAADASSPLDWWTDLLKIRADDNADGYLIHPDTDLSITAIADLWSEHEHDFDFLNDMQEIDILINTSTPPTPPPPSATLMPSVSNTIAEIDRYCWESMRDDTTTAGTNTPQDQTLPPISTATPSVLNTIGDIGWDSSEMIHEDNATASISAPQAQTQPPINTAMPSVPNKIADIGWDSPEMIHEHNVTVSISAPQAQTPPQINTAMPSAPNAIAEMGWDSMEMTHEDNAMADIGASQAETPPPVNTAMPFVSNMIADNIIHEDNIMTSTNTTQAQTTQGCATAIASVSRTTGSRNESVRRSMAEVNPNSETAEVTPAAHKRAPIHKVYKRRAKAQVRRETVGHTACKEKE